MFAEIIPLSKFPRSIQSLTYKIPEKLIKKAKVGQLVNINIRNKHEKGVIFSIFKKNNFFYPIKNIDSLVNTKIIFSSRQLELFHQLGKFYQVSPTLFTHTSLPKIIDSEWAKIPNNISTTTENKTTKTKYFLTSSNDKKIKYYKKTISSELKKNKSILIVSPQIENLLSLEKNLQPLTTPRLIHHRLSRKDKITRWTELLKNKPLLYLGSRSALFYPLDNISTIIIDDANSPFHKQEDMNPRYDTKTVIGHIQKIYKTKIISSSSTPSLDLYKSMTIKEKKSLDSIKYPHVNLVNIKNELQNKNFTLISEALIRHIKETLDKNKNIFILANRKGESTSVTCENCANTLKCPKCQSIFSYGNENKLCCYNCGHSEIMPPFCPKCTHPDFRMRGIGIEKITKNLQQIFPNKKINTIYQGQDIDLNKKYDITIGTRFALPRINLSQISLFTFFNIDGLWQHSELNSAEQGFYLINEILTTLPRDAKIIAQTFNSESKIISSICQNKPSEFYEDELKNRKNFHYPPFFNIIKISILEKTNEKAKKESDKLYEKIKKHEDKKEIYVNPPLPTYPPKIRNKYKFNIIIKIKNLDKLSSITKNIDQNKIIDINPNNLTN